MTYASCYAAVTFFLPRGHTWLPTPKTIFVPEKKKKKREIAILKMIFHSTKILLIFLILKTHV